MTDKVQKIREEIEKRLKGERFLSSDKEYNYLLSFIDSLQEEPVSESLEAFIKERVKNIPLVLRSGFHQLCRQLIRDGAEWRFEQIKEVLLSEVLPCFMHGGEADEVVAKLDEVLNQKK